MRILGAWLSFLLYSSLGTFTAVPASFLAIFLFQFVVVCCYLRLQGFIPSCMLACQREDRIQEDVELLACGGRSIKYKSTEHLLASPDFLSSFQASYPSSH